MKVGTLSASGGEEGEEFELSLLNDNGGRFALVGNDLHVAAPIGSEFTRDMAATRTIRVRAIGDMSTIYDQDIVLNVTRTVGIDPRFNSWRQKIVAPPFNGARTIRLDVAAAISGRSYSYGDCFIPKDQKSYFEVSHLGSSNATGGPIIGIGSMGFPFEGAATGGPGGTWQMPPSNGVYFNSDTALTGKAASVASDNDRLMVAYDPATGNVWFGKNGTWNEGDPAAGTGAAFTLSTVNRARLLRPVFGLSLGAQIGSWRQFTLHGRSEDFAHTPPSGFSALTSNGPQPTRLDSALASASIAISNEGRTATKTAENTTARTAQTNSGMLGKMVCAWRVDKWTSGIMRVGLLAHTSTVGTLPTLYLSYRSDTGVVTDATAVGPTYATWTQGDTVMLAWDQGAGVVWFGKNGTWNGDPGAGTGHVTWSSGTATNVSSAAKSIPFCSLVAIGDAITLLGGADYPYEIPAGFRVFDDYVAFVPPPLLDDEDPEPDPEEDEAIEDEIPPDDPDPDPVDTDPDDPDPTVVAEQRQKWNLDDASTALLSDVMFLTGKRILRHRETGSVRGFNPIYGRKYWEHVYHYVDPLDARIGSVGVGTLSADIEAPPGEDDDGAGYRIDGKVRHDGADEQSYPSWAAISPGDRIGVAFDSITRRIWFAKNGVWQGSPGTASIGTVTISTANPAVVTRTAHGLADLEQIYFTTTNTLPSPITANTRYYVRLINANTFNISLTPSGSLISTSGSSQSGTHTIHYGVGTGQALTLPAGAYYPMIWLDERGGGIVSWRKIGYVVTAFAAFSPHGATFNQKYLPPTGFTPFAPFV